MAKTLLCPGREAAGAAQGVAARPRSPARGTGSPPGPDPKFAAAKQSSEAPEQTTATGEHGARHVT